ncbi:bifunctional non-homologous end joining protein LigD [Methanolinea mesophila]|uniref:non-homologous end-joining DNA ligase n=1 Tax=Methanolinea mesophila TaxID=547055 RepID=UPI001AE259AC|nr:non-homologous end-joining DNA ligase [Methanolinea mesophila]MBP1929792.1 bifunctional non-homologous end joining protein LigD [Methanolinea mesophila]
MTTRTFGPNTVNTSHEEKVFFPGGITKGDLIDYYVKIGEAILPHLRDRPISMQRFPDGIGKEGFYQKEVPDYFPDWIPRAEVSLKDGTTQPQVVVGNIATLAFLADQGCITPHTWLSRTDRLNRPDKMIFDLDPPGEDFEPVRTAAFAMKEVLDELRIRSFVMTTGSRGLHVVVPLDQGMEFDPVREIAKEIAMVAVMRHPSRLTMEIRKEKRKGRLFLDTLRNAYAQTSVPPYAVRARPGAPVAAPLDWDELNDPDITSGSYTIRNIFIRLDRKKDPMAGMPEYGISLENRRDDIRALTGQKTLG